MTQEKSQVCLFDSGALTTMQRLMCAGNARPNSWISISYYSSLPLWLHFQYMYFFLFYTLFILFKRFPIFMLISLFLFFSIFLFHFNMIQSKRLLSLLLFFCLTFINSTCNLFIIWSHSHSIFFLLVNKPRIRWIRNQINVYPISDVIHSKTNAIM